MSRTRRISAAAFAALALCATSIAVPASLAIPKKQCAPGQQGNPHPGFKPGAC